MASIEFVTSSRTSSGSAKVSISTVIFPNPCFASETTRSTPLSPMTLSSTRRLISSSISFGVEPGDGIVIVMVRRFNSGKFCIGSWNAAINPPMMRNTISRFAAIRLRAKYAINPVLTLVPEIEKFRHQQMIKSSWAKFKSNRRLIGSRRSPWLQLNCELNLTAERSR